jgi:hypothetical protein
MSGFIKKIALASVLAAGAATNASAAIVTNGSFENGLTGWTTFGGGTTPGLGITVITTGGTNSTGYGDNVPNYNGTHAAFFVDDNAFETLSQFVTLAANTNYTLSFGLFATASGANNPFGFALTDLIFGTSVFDVAINNNAFTDVPVGTWTTHTYNFTTAFSGSYLLNFSFLSGHSPAKDVLLDGVNIAPTQGAVPEPATWAMMLGGFALVGAAMRRRPTAVSFA